MHCWISEHSPTHKIYKKKTLSKYMVYTVLYVSVLAIMRFMCGPCLKWCFCLCKYVLYRDGSPDEARGCQDVWISLCRVSAERSLSSHFCVCYMNTYNVFRPFLHSRNIHATSFYLTLGKGTTMCVEKTLCESSSDICGRKVRVAHYSFREGFLHQNFIW